MLAKSFENWLLVELVHVLFSKGVADVIRTNGHLGGHTMPGSKVKGFSSSKARGKHLSMHLSLDISVHLVGRPKGEFVSAELRVGLSGKPILNEIPIIRAYREAEVCDRSDLGWIVLFPEDDEANHSTRKTFERIYRKMAEENSDSDFTQKDVTDWLRLCVAFPNGPRRAKDIGRQLRRLVRYYGRSPTTGTSVQ